MFHWICPECGREIPPAVKECPACDPAACLESPSQESTSEPAEIQAAAEAAEIQAEPPAQVNVEAPHVPPVQPLLHVPLDAAPEKSAAEPQPIESQLAESRPNADFPLATPLPGALLRLAQKLRDAQRDLELAAANPAGRVPERSLAASKPAEPPTDPRSSSQPEPISPAPAPQMLLLQAASVAIALLPPPELASPELASPEPEQPRLEPEPNYPAAGAVPNPSLAPRASAPSAAPKPSELAALPAAPSAAELSQPALVAASSPAPAALTLAPLQDSSTLARRIRMAAPSNQILRPDAGPRVTLPGPTLPPALNSLQDAGLSRILVARPKSARKRSRGWLTGVAVAALLLTGFVALDLYNAPGTAADLKSAPTEAPAPPQSKGDTKGEAKAEPAAAASPASSYSLTKAIEVTGFRFVGDKKPEVRYLVVNHSGGDLGAVTVYVTLRSSAAKPGQPPLYRFSFRTPALGPFESKELSASLDKAIDKSVHPADWQSLHADIELGQ